MQVDNSIRQRRHSRLSSPAFILSLILVLIGFAAAWSLFWWFAAHQTEALLDAWIKREKSVDRIWTCPDRQIAGYPLRIEISCSKAGFSGEVFGKQVVGSLKGVHIEASLLHPDRADALPEAPFEVQSTNGDGEINLRWDQMRVHLDGLPQDLVTGSIEGTNVALQGGIKGLGNLAGHAGRLSSLIVAIPERRAEDAYSLHLALDNASIPILDTLLDSAASDAIKFDGTMTKVDFRAAGTIAERLDHWRLTGGHLEVSEAMVTHGPTKVAAHGILGLDDQRRPQGQLDAQFAGAEPILRRFGVNPSLIGAGSLLSSLLGGRQNGNAANDGSPTLRLPVTLRAGFISIGPVKTPLAIPPLY